MEMERGERERRGKEKERRKDPHTLELERFFERKMHVIGRATPRINMCLVLTVYQSELIL